MVVTLLDVAEAALARPPSEDREGVSSWLEKAGDGIADEAQHDGGDTQRGAAVLLAHLRNRARAKIEHARGWTKTDVHGVWR